MSTFSARVKKRKGNDDPTLLLLSAFYGVDSVDTMCNTSRPFTGSDCIHMMCGPYTHYW